jgi:Cell wall-associated hydrolases (invasion-associated proteins)
VPLPERALRCPRRCDRFACSPSPAPQSSLAACGGPRTKPEPLPRFTAPTRHKGEVSANDILFRAIALVGTPYRHGGNTPQGGFDCSGLVEYVFRDVAGIVLPRTAQDISEIGAPEVRRDRLESGDLVFFRQSWRVSHVGIYVGEGRFVHAPNEGGTVRLDLPRRDYWDKHFSSAKRIPL